MSNTKKSEMDKVLRDIEFALRQNAEKIDKFENANYTLGWLSGIIKRVNNCEVIYK